MPVFFLLLLLCLLCHEKAFARLLPGQKGSWLRPALLRSRSLSVCLSVEWSACQQLPQAFAIRQSPSCTVVFPWFIFFSCVSLFVRTEETHVGGGGGGGPLGPPFQLATLKRAAGSCHRWDHSIPQVSPQFHEFGCGSSSSSSSSGSSSSGSSSSGSSSTGTLSCVLRTEATGFSLSVCLL
ncbi:hypothetical protein Efla_000941 [Eimeria flavescens]